MFRNKYSIPAHLTRMPFRHTHTPTGTNVQSRRASTLQATSDEQANEVILINIIATKSKMWAVGEPCHFTKTRKNNGNTIYKI
jgi:hypothetical protein